MMEKTNQRATKMEILHGDYRRVKKSLKTSCSRWIRRINKKEADGIIREETVGER